MWKYSEQLMDHFMNPRNVGTLESPDGHAEVGSPICGDAMTLDIAVDDSDHIEEIKFRTFGCAGAIASASALTEMAKGKTLDEALAIKNRQIADYLGGMPEEKYHCSVMGHEALHAAISDYRKKSAEVAEAAGLAIAKAGAALALRRARPGKAVLAGEVADPAILAGSLAAAISESLGRPIEVELEKE
jgi:NifU-like protein